MTHRIIQERGLVGDFFCADAPAPRPTVLLLGGSEGGKGWSDTPEAVGLLAPLVGQGLNVLPLAYFGAEGPPATLEMIPLKYFEAAFGWLAAQPEVVPDCYALMGGSRGGRTRPGAGQPLSAGEGGRSPRARFRRVPRHRRQSGRSQVVLVVPGGRARPSCRTRPKQWRR